MRAYHATACFLLAFAASAGAAPPALDLPAEVRPAQGYARLTPKTDAVSVTYVALDGLYPFPSEELKDARRFVLPTAGVKPGRYRYVAVAASKTGEQASAEFVVVVPGEVKPDPIPDPKPVDPVKPDPKPADPLTSFRVILVSETGAALTREQFAVLYAKKVSDWLDANTTPDGWRRYDKDARTDGDRPAINAVWSDAKPKVKSVPCVAVERNGKVEVVPFEGTPEAMIAKLAALREGK